MEGKKKADGYGLVYRSLMTYNGISYNAKAIYAYLSSYAGANGVAFPPIDRILQELCIGKDQFYKYRKELVDNGIMEIIKAKKGKFKNNVYKINKPPFLFLKDTVEEKFDIEILFRQIESIYNKQDEKPFTLQQVKDIFEYFFKEYNKTLNKDHSKLTNKSIQSIIERLPFYKDDYNAIKSIEYYFYKPMIDKYFQTKFDRNYSMIHFMNDKIRELRFYETCY